MAILGGLYLLGPTRTHVCEATPRFPEIEVDDAMGTNAQKAFDSFDLHSNSEYRDKEHQMPAPKMIWSRTRRLFWTCLGLDYKNGRAKARDTIWNIMF